MPAATGQPLSLPGPLKDLPNEGARPFAWPEISHSRPKPGAAGFEFQPDHETKSTNLPDNVWEFLLQRFQLIEEKRSDALDIFLQSFALDDLEDLQGDCASEGSTAEGGRMSPRRKNSAYFSRPRRPRWENRLLTTSPLRCRQAE